MLKKYKEMKLDWSPGFVIAASCIGIPPSVTGSSLHQQLQVAVTQIASTMTVSVLS
jgi:hypothetical protein